MLDTPDNTETPLLPTPLGAPLDLSEGWRVSEDSIQWILQRRDPNGRWRDRSSCRSRAGLLRCVREYCGEVEWLPLVTALPEWHP